MACLPLIDSQYPNQLHTSSFHNFHSTFSPIPSPGHPLGHASRPTPLLSHPSTTIGFLAAWLLRADTSVRRPFFEFQRVFSMTCELISDTRYRSPKGYTDSSGVGAAHGGILRGPSTSEHRRTSVPAPARVSALSHIGFSHRRGVLRPPFRTLHGLLGY